MRWAAWATWATQATQLNFYGERKREREAHDGGEDQKMVKSLRSTFLRDTVWLVKQFSVRARILVQKPDKSRTSMISVKGRLEVFFGWKYKHGPKIGQTTYYLPV